MTIEAGDKLKRKRGRPSPKTTTAPVTGYLGPSLDDILRMSDTEIQVSFDQIGIEPSPFKWNPEDDQINVAHWHDYGMTLSDTDRMKTQPKDKTGMKVLEASSKAIHQAGLRTELLAAHVQRWIGELDDVALVEQVQRLSETHMSESEKRYCKRSDMQQRVMELTWPVLVNASTLYTQPSNPLGGTM